MDGEMEVSIMELYYNAKNCFCEYEKGIVCGKVALRSLYHSAQLTVCFIFVIMNRRCRKYKNSIQKNRKFLLSC